MAGFVRRFTEFPTIEVLTEIEAINVVDQPPPASVSGIGTGTLLLVGEYEDGPFAAGGDSAHWDGDAKGTGPQLVFSSEDLRQRFGGFGFTYGGVPHGNPCARRHLQELWNGNAFLKLKFLRPRRLVCARVDTSVGEVAMQALACISGDAGPYDLEPGQTFDVTTEAGGPATTAPVAAAVATAAGAGFVSPTLFAGGETITVQIDGGPTVSVVFSAADQLVADVVNRINLALGFTSAVVNVGEVDISGIQRGLGGDVTLADVTPGTLAQIGHSAGSTAGTGNVSNVDAATAAEVAAIVNASGAVTAINGAASVAADGTLRICSTTPGTGQVQVDSSALSLALGLSPLGSLVDAGVHAGGTIVAGTRVRDGSGDEWVTLQALTVPAGTAAAPQGGPFVVKVRPALDEGSATGAGAGTVTTIVDQPTFADLVVTNPAALTAALTEGQLDAAYEAAWDRTINIHKIVREVNHSLCARQSDIQRLKGRLNAIQASAQGHFGRKFHASAPIGFTQAQATAQVALNRSDRVFYAWPGWRVRIPEIAARGAAGGLGFNDTGRIDVRGDGPLASINCQLPPEENPGQATGLIENFLDLESNAPELDIDAYKALKAAGICAPRRDRTSGSIYQSGVTSVDPLTDANLVTQARRKIADFIQDSQAIALVPYSKKLNKQSRRDSVRAIMEQFVGGLKSPNNPELSRIEDYSIDEESGNTPATLARGIFVLIEKVRTYSSLDAIVLQTEIGEGVVIVTELA